MVRASLSFVFAFAILLPLAIMSEAYPCRLFDSIKLINAATGGWVKNFPAGSGRPPFITGAIIDDSYASVYERWNFENHPGGHAIINEGSGYYLTAYQGEAVGSSVFEKANSKWVVEAVGGGKVVIKALDQDLVMTARGRYPGSPISIFLEPYNGSNEQKWIMEHV